MSPLVTSSLAKGTEIVPFLLMLRFDMDLNAAKDDSNSEVQAKVRLAREKEQLQAEHTELKEKYKVKRIIHLSYEISVM